MARRRRLSSDESDKNSHNSGNSLRWVLTYADMITLLLAFFLMLYAMSILNLNKFQQVAGSIRSGFNGTRVGQSPTVPGKNGAFSIKPIPGVGKPVNINWPVENKIRNIVKERGFGKMVKLRNDERGLVISLVTDKAIFTRGQADMSPTTRQVIDAVVKPIKAISNKVIVEGHTCDLPIQSDKYPSNWELSTARAASVIRYLIEEVGIAPERLSAAGYADSKPLVPNNSESNRAQNRRVDIIILRTDQELKEVKS